MTAFVSESRVRTERASRYLGQLCMHFEHKLPTTYDKDHGRIAFDAGTCHLDVEEKVLVIRAEADDEVSLARLRGVVGSHLERFAFRDKPEILWKQVS